MNEDLGLLFYTSEDLPRRKVHVDLRPATSLHQDMHAPSFARLRAEEPARICTHAVRTVMHAKQVCGRWRLAGGI